LKRKDLIVRVLNGTPKKEAAPDFDRKRQGKN